MNAKPVKCVCHGKPRFRKAPGGWCLVCECGRQCGTYASKDAATQGWNQLILRERGVLHD